MLLTFWRTMASSRLSKASKTTGRLALKLESLEDRVTPAGQQIVATTVEYGIAPVVSVYDANTRELKLSVSAYESTFTGGVRVAVGDVTGDGVEDLVTGAGPGGGAVVKVFSGVDGALVRSIIVGDATNRGGASVAVADFDGDGKADVVVGAVSGGSELVQVFKGTDGTVLNEFRPFGAAVDGIMVAAGDYNGDGTADVFVGAGLGGAPRVTVLDGISSEVLLNTFVFESTFRGGVQIAAGDLDGDRRAELVAAAGADGGPRVVVLAGGTGEPTLSFFAYDSSGRGGIRVAVFDLNRDGANDVVTTNGTGQSPEVKGFDGRSLATLSVEPFTSGLPVQAAPTRSVISGVTPSSGPSSGATTVTITGSGFTGATAVTFGGADATSFTVDSDTQITAVTPAGTAGVTAVQVTTAGGTSTADAYTYVAAPTIAGITPATGRLTGGATVTITGNGLTGATAVTFGGADATSFTVDSDTQITAVTPPGGNGPADVAVTTVGGTATATNAFTYTTPAVAILFDGVGFSEYFADTETFVPILDASAASNVQAYGVDFAGRVAYDLGNNGLSLFDPNTGQTTLIFSTDTSALAVAGNGLIYFAKPSGAASELGTYVFDSRLGSAVRFTTEIATSMVAAANGVMYGQFQSGFYVYDPATADFSLITTDPVGSGYDTNGDGSSLYLTLGGNLFRYIRTATGFDPVQLTDGINIIAIAVSPNDYMYIDTSVNGTRMYDPTTGTVTVIDTRNPVFVVADQAGNGYFDYAGNGGTLRYDLATGQFVTLSSNPNAFFGRDDVDTTGSLYLDYNSQGLYRFDPATSATNSTFAGSQISTLNPLSTSSNG